MQIARSTRIVALLLGCMLAGFFASDMLGQQRSQLDVFGYRGLATRDGKTDLLSLLSLDDVRRELNTNDRQYNAIQQISEALFLQTAQRGVNVFGLNEQQREVYLEQRREFHKQREAFVREQLGGILQPQQVKRLEQIQYQARGAGALQDDDVVEKLKLSGEQQQRIKDLTRQAEQRMEGLKRGLLQSGNPELIRRELEKAREEISGQFLSVLNKEQQKDYNELRGEPFEVPRRVFDSRQPFERNEYLRRQ